MASVHSSERSLIRINPLGSSDLIEIGEAIPIMHYHHFIMSPINKRP